MDDQLYSLALNNKQHTNIAGKQNPGIPQTNIVKR